MKSLILFAAFTISLSVNAQTKDSLINNHQLQEVVVASAANLIIDNLKSSFPLIQTIDLKLTKLNPPMGADCNGAGVELHIEY